MKRLRYPALFVFQRLWVGLAVLACSIVSLSHAQTVLTNRSIDASLSGAWFDPGRSGEGIVVEMLPDGGAIAVWFTYPASGEAGDQAWLIGDTATRRGSTLTFANVYRPQGAKFGDAFDPQAVQRTPWGTLSLERFDCDTLKVRYSGPSAFGAGERTYTRLTAVREARCDGARALTTSGARAAAGLRSTSGAWYVPARSGEGWLIEEIGNDLASLYWFTFDADGQQAFITGVGNKTASGYRFQDVIRTRGTRFGDGFNAAQVERRVWGTVEFELNGCDAARVRFTSVDARFGSGERLAARLTALAGAPCIDTLGSAKVSGDWVERATMPTPFSSEHAAVAREGRVYVLGGFGDRAGFKAFDVAQNAWTRLPNMPSDRDHLSAFVDGDAVAYCGGATNGAANPACFRFDLNAQTWSPIAGVNPSYGSHAAVLHGKTYIGNADGSLQTLDLASREVARIAPATFAGERDHSQVVAFLDEIWMIGGRTPETASAAIYDPASGAWRRGPSMQRSRAGFAAAVVGNQIVVSGGELLTGTPRVESRTEVIAAGESMWVAAQNVPVPTHGNAAASVGNTIYIVSGSTRAGEAVGAIGRVWAWTPQ